MSVIKLGNDYLLWFGAPNATETALAAIQGQGTATINQSQAKIDTASKTTGGYATSAPGLKDITIDLDITPLLPDAQGYTLFETQCNAIPNVPFPVEIRKNGLAGVAADAVFSAVMYGTITSVAFTQNDKVAAKAQLLLAAAPSINALS